MYIGIVYFSDLGSRNYRGKKKAADAIKPFFKVDMNLVIPDIVSHIET